LKLSEKARTHEVITPFTVKITLAARVAVQSGIYSYLPQIRRNVLPPINIYQTIGRHIPEGSVHKATGPGIMSALPYTLTALEVQAQFSSDGANKFLRAVTSVYDLRFLETNGRG
jgi:hypothetical protein